MGRKLAIGATRRGPNSNFWASTLFETLLCPCLLSQDTMGDDDKTDEIREQLPDDTVGGTVDDSDDTVLTLDDGEVESEGDEAGLTSDGADDSNSE